MDENYLDNLLNEFSLDKEIDHKIEEELDEQIQSEKRSYQDSQEIDKNAEFDLDLNRDSEEMDESFDFSFSEEQMEELDELDELADLDIGDLDFSDIDFDDIDMTNLSQIDDEGVDELLKDFEGDLEIKEFLHEDKPQKQEDDSDVAQVAESNEQDVQEQTESESIASPNEEDNSDQSQENQENDDLNEDTFDANNFLDSLLEETEKQEAESQPFEELPDEGSDYSKAGVVPQNIDLEETDSSSESDENQSATPDTLQTLDDLDDFNQSMEEAQNPMEKGSGNEEEFQGSLDDLLSMLDMEDNANIPDVQSLDETLEQLEGEDSNLGSGETSMAGAADVSETKKKAKRSLMQILFGDDDDDDDELSEEELAAIEAKKAAKKAKKEAAKAAKKEKKEASKAQKAQDNDQKKKSADEKKRLKAEKKQQRRAEEAANAEPEKKLNKPAVIFIFTFFLGGLMLFFVVSNDFNYTQVIKKAATYFSNQKYRRAYDEIVGVEVKDKDQELKDRIYTVMYVERLYEAYNNNIKLGYEEKALDSLLRGVDKYFEHYEEASELGILSDLNYSFEQIKQELMNEYGISVEQATDINRLENADYVRVINEYVEKKKQSLPQEDVMNSQETADIKKEDNIEDETK